MLIYYALIVFYLAPDWKQAELVSIPVGGDLAKCTQVLKHRVSQQAAKGNLKGHLSECVLMLAPK